MPKNTTSMFRAHGNGYTDHTTYTLKTDLPRISNDSSQDPMIAGRKATIILGVQKYYAPEVNPYYPWVSYEQLKKYLEEHK